jgi:hypothetical protein
MGEDMKRRGRFTIPRKLLMEDFEAVSGIFQLCFPVRAEMMFDQDNIEYTAIGHVFDEVPKDTITPWYTVMIDRDGLTVGIEFHRRENN